MWWPKLEDEIKKILKSSDKVVKKKLRSERDILEELLELARSSSGLVEDMAILKKEFLKPRMVNLIASPITSGTRTSAFGPDVR